ncbi:hypothetical protein E4U19_003289 [Claviceps sp. Clav32 group G5]|nr:hypothetical protein E4U19_003289 [Claviceps sp. Clav32 group G5]
MAGQWSQVLRPSPGAIRRRRPKSPSSSPYSHVYVCRFASIVQVGRREILLQAGGGGGRRPSILSRRVIRI